jgi:outer membrane protein assembly factor BamB
MTQNDPWDDSMTSNHRRRQAVFYASMVLLSQYAIAGRADDWPQWGGPQRDLVWREEGIVDRLPTVNEDGVLPRVWSVPIGPGYTGPAVADGRVFCLDRDPDKNTERVYCLDAATGDEQWHHEYPAPYTISYPLGPRATPTVDGDRVYTLGAMGHLICFDVASGRPLWKKDLPSEVNAKLPIWGMAGAPLVEGDNLIVLAGGQPDGLVIALDKRTGEERWRALDDEGVGYCSPVILKLGERRELIVWHPEALSALNPADGHVLWEVPYSVQAGMTITTPRAVLSQYGKQRLLVTTFYNGPLMIELDDHGTSPEVIWRSKPGNSETENDSLHAVMCTPILTPQYVFGVGSYGELRCLNADTGKIEWETREPTGRGRWWNAFLVPQEDRVFVCNEQGELIIARLSSEGYEELDRAKLIEPTQPIQRRMTVWSHPAFAMQSVFARNDKELVRVNLAAVQ